MIGYYSIIMTYEKIKTFIIGIELLSGKFNFSKAKINTFGYIFASSII